MRSVTARHVQVAIASVIVCGGIIAVVVPTALSSKRRTLNEAPPTASGLALDASAWNFGAVRQEAGVLSHTFHLTNRLDVPLRVRPIEIGCNCVSVDCPESIGARCTVPIKVVIEIRNREGAFTTRVALSSMDRPDIPPVELTMRFYAEPPINVDPPVLRLTDVRRGSKVQHDIRVITRLEHGQEAAIEPLIELQ